MQQILAIAIPAIMGLVVKTLKPEQLEKIADKALDWVEAAIKKSENKYDDEIVLPLIELIREAFSVKCEDAK